MNFFCPRCHQRISSQDASLAACPSCGMLLDLARADTDTDAGRPILAPTRDLTGSTLGRFRLEAWLGTGGMGVVYRGVDTESGEPVAVKLLAPLLCRQPDIVERFHREARALAGLTHPHIVAFRAEGTAPGVGPGEGDQHYIAMELVTGETLEALLERGTPLSPGLAVGIARQIAEALAAAHKQGIVHRDLKPANVIVSPAQVKVLDFGIAHVAIGDHTLTHSDAILGTVNYMAPEQRTRAAAVDRRADIFSLGVILYRSLTGALPLGSFEPLSHLNPALDRRFDRVVLKMLQRDPERRYASVEALLPDLVRLARPPRRTAIGIAAAATAAAAALGVAVAIGGFPEVGPAPGAAGGPGLAVQGQGGAAEVAAASATTAPMAGQDATPANTVDAQANVVGVASTTTNAEAPIGQRLDVTKEPVDRPPKPAPLITKKPAFRGKLALGTGAPAVGLGNGELAKQLTVAEGGKTAAPVAEGTAAPTPDDAQAGIQTKAAAAVAGYYRVVGVEPKEMLAVRAKPIPQAEQLAALASDRRCVTFTGKRKSSGKGADWWLVEYGAGDEAIDGNGGIGWVDARFLEPEAPGECGGKKKPRKKGKGL